MKTTLRLTLDVEYETNGVPVEQLDYWLKAVALRAYDEGHFTFNSDAYVEAYSYKVETLE